MQCFVYILYSEKLDKFYTGSSHNPELRLHYHNLGKKGWTKAGIPWESVFQHAFDNNIIAREKELFIKKQKSKIYIEKLISGEYTI